MPHLRSLVERYQDQPFELIGINTGDGPADYRKGLEDFKVTWLSAYQGSDSPIADLYAVQGYPTYLIIDVDGKIAFRGHGGGDDVIERLVKAAQEKSDK